MRRRRLLGVLGASPFPNGCEWFRWWRETVRAATAALYGQLYSRTTAFGVLAFGLVCRYASSGTEPLAAHASRTPL